MRGDTSSGNVPAEKAVIGTYAESEEQLKHIGYLVESIREFGGRFASTMVRIYIPEKTRPTLDSLVSVLESQGTSIIEVAVAEESEWLFYAGKVFAAALAETEATGNAEILIWLDDDTIVMSEPGLFLLPDTIDFAYRPVMHNRSGSLWGQATDPFWSRIYELSRLSDSVLFPMTTPADLQTIRAYFNAGLLVVRPERGILRGWAGSFRTLYGDSLIAAACREDQIKRIFLHQMALVGPVFHGTTRDRMMELPSTYNYPIFFRSMYGGEVDFESIDDVVTLRYDVYFRNPEEDWVQKLRGNPDKIAWLGKRLGSNQQTAH